MLSSKKKHEFNLLDLLNHYWKHKLMIITFSVVIAIAMLCVTEFIIKDKYTASGVLYISSESASSPSKVNQSDIVTARYIVSTYMETLKLRSLLSDVSQMTGGIYTWEEISDMLTLTQLNKTEFISVSVTSDDPKAAYDIASCICDNANNIFSKAFKGGSATVADKVVFPEDADDKGYIRNTLAGAATGAIIAITLLTIGKLLDDKLHRSEELRTRYSLPILGETAQIIKGQKKKNEYTSESEQVHRVLNENTDFDTVETYKSIRTNIMLSIPKKSDGKVILLTSASPSEGKTTTSINTAITFSQMGAKTILLDCDLRRARVHRYMQISRGNGITNVTCGYSRLQDAIRYNVRPNLDVLTAGDIPPNPSELLLTEQFKNMINTLRRQYDYIILDTPPITVVTDATIISEYSDGVILVTREGATSLTLLNSAVTELRRVKANIFGAIVHDCVEKRKKYYYANGEKKYSDYNYRYGDEPTATKSNKL